MRKDNNMNITLHDEIIKSIIFTLKQLDIRGYDSMDKLVGTVTLLERLLQQAEEMAEEPEAK